MQIKGKSKAFCTKYVKKANQARDGLTAELDVEITTTRKQAEKLMGAEFATLAFGSVIEIEGDDGTETVHLADSIKAGSRFKADKHSIEINEIEVITKPKILGVAPVHKSEKVCTGVRIPVHIGGDDRLGGKLQALVGGDVEIKFSETQKSLPFEDEEGGEG